MLRRVAAPRVAASVLRARPTTPPSWIYSSRAPKAARIARVFSHFQQRPSQPRTFSSLRSIPRAAAEPATVRPAVQRRRPYSTTSSSSTAESRATTSAPSTSVPPSATSEPTASDSVDAAPGLGPEKPDYLDAAETVIWDRLTAEFEPTELVVQDISGGCGSMYGIEICSEKFRGENMLKQQRMVNGVLADLMKGWHGVQLRTRVP